MSAITRRAATSSALLGRYSRSRAFAPSPQAMLMLMRAYSTEPTPHSSPSGPPVDVLSSMGKSASSRTIVQPKRTPVSDPAKAGKKTEVDAEFEEVDAAKAVAEKSADKATENILGKETEVPDLPTVAADSASTTPATAEKPKSSLWQKVKDGVRHTWDSTKLLGVEIKISTKLALKMVAGYELTRRESRQLQRTTQDLIRLVPFSVFLIVPFAELLLPIALKLFPGLLPSTFEAPSTKEKRVKSLRNTRKEVSKFLRSTVKETGLALPQTHNNAQRELFADFFRKIRTSGESPSREELLSVCRLFKDDMILDNLSRPQLVAMSKYMNLQTFGTDMMLRYQIRRRMRQTKRDDRAIDYEGVESLSVRELQGACQVRGIKSHGVSPARLREDLQTWLDLTLRQHVPSTLLVLSAAYTYGSPESVDSHYDALLSTLSSIPDQLYHEAELEVNHLEGTATNKQRLEVLKEQEQLINNENEQVSMSGTVVKDHESIDESEVAEGEADKEELPENAEAKEAAEAEQLEEPKLEKLEEPKAEQVETPEPVAAKAQTGEVKN
ncbi:LETM1-like protein-domain-containing protein [Myxozyma melibiosi]|uniref:LETM1-like protein-domain-containing protein n=1 Tax=Myxozyma melibiosi TaxID=54550 RepID=A0ABR1F6Z2_9ASCO